MSVSLIDGHIDRNEQKTTNIDVLRVILAEVHFKVSNGMPMSHSDRLKYKKVIDAIDKQIPKKPKNREGTTYFYCPCCDSNNIYEYCGDYGQALDWSDTK